MRYMLLIYSDPAARSTMDEVDLKEMMNGYWTFTSEIQASGEMLAGDPLQGLETATTVRVRSGKTAATDGPFAETKEVLNGYYIVDVPDLDRAIELAGKIPDAGTGSVEIRPIQDMSAE